MDGYDDKLTYLRKLLRLYVKFFKHYTNVEVWIAGKNKQTLEIKYHGKKCRNAPFYFHQESIPAEDIDKVIAKTRNKVSKEIQNRHDNKYLNRTEVLEKTIELKEFTLRELVQTLEKIYREEGVESIVVRCPREMIEKVMVEEGIYIPKRINVKFKFV